MAIIVQKFGGTSVNTPEKRSRVLEVIAAAKQKGYDVVVVVSAMGRKGEPYATDTFLDLLKGIGPEADPRTMDLLTSCGEIISACLVAHALEQRGIKARPLTGYQAGIITNNCYTNAEIQNINPEKLMKILKEGFVAVVAGFQGINADSDICTLGRGGSDTTAIALGGALQAERVEIYTDVPGVAFTDPRILPEAPYLKKISFEPLYLMSRAGAKVIHHRAVETAINFRMPFYVKSTFTDDEGTLIGQKGENFGGLYGIAVMKEVCCLQTKKEDTVGYWRHQAVDELFYQNSASGAFVVAQMPSDCTGIASAEACALLTVLWEHGSGVNANSIDRVLEKKGMTLLGFFPLIAGGAWAVKPEQAQDAVRAIYEAYLK
ncbi:MAG: aspartate kinase [Clostridia bacterium]|jgi:aspartate kinase|nr:aspartate kinase [Clostridia bacterium]